MRVSGDEDRRVRGFEGSRCLGFEISRVEGSTDRGLEGSRARGLEGSRLRGCKGSRVRGFEGARVRVSPPSLWRFDPLRSRPVCSRATMCRRAALRMPVLAVGGVPNARIPRAHSRFRRWRCERRCPEPARVRALLAGSYGSDGCVPPPLSPASHCPAMCGCCRRRCGGDSFLDRRSRRRSALPLHGTRRSVRDADVARRSNPA